jgi:biopolymer transport protein TolR
MTSRKQKRVGTSPQFNMTPLIDVTFLLIIFFLLVNDIIAEQDVQLLLPELDHSQVVQLDQPNRLVINIIPDHHTPTTTRLGLANPLAVNGGAQWVKVGLARFAINQPNALTAFLVEARTARPNLAIVLRADAAVEYQYVEPVMEAIADAQIKHVLVTAYLPEQGPNRAP